MLASIALINTLYLALQGRPGIVLSWKWVRNINVCNQAQRHNQYIPQQPSTLGRTFHYIPLKAF